MRTLRSALAAVAFVAASSALQAAPAPLVPQGAAPAATFNKLHTYEEIVDLLKAYAAAYPKWTRLESVGKSGQGRDLWMITLTNPATGPELSKPAMYID
ncbi:MAG TPA: M14 family zinc carboxypeptidase, partial [Thermoanaerobaculia bacterium]